MVVCFYDPVFGDGYSFAKQDFQTLGCDESTSCPTGTSCKCVHPSFTGSRRNLLFASMPSYSGAIEPETCFCLP